MKTKTRVKEIESFLRDLNTEIDILNYIDVENVNNFDELFQEIQENNGFDIEIIYYYKAIEYLKNNDPSLQESFEIASEFGFQVKDLNSELLASLLASQNTIDEFLGLESEINRFFTNLTK